MLYPTHCNCKHCQGLIPSVITDNVLQNPIPAYVYTPCDEGKTINILYYTTLLLYVAYVSHVAIKHRMFHGLYACAVV